MKKLKTLGALGAIGALALLAPAPGVAAPLWSADAEAPMVEEWASNSSLPTYQSPPCPDPTRIRQDGFAAQGLRSYRFELRAGDDFGQGARAELGMAMPPNWPEEWRGRLFREGEERYLSLQYFLQEDWPTDNTWQVVFQIKPSTEGGGGPNIGISTGGNELEFYGNGNGWGSTDGEYRDGNHPLAKGRWIKLTLHVVFSADPRKGVVEWFGDLGDGHGMRTLAPLRNRATLKLHDGTPNPGHLRVGIYRNPIVAQTAVAYVDGVTLATTRAEAEQGAFAIVSRRTQSSAPECPPVAALDAIQPTLAQASD